MHLYMISYHLVDTIAMVVRLGRDEIRTDEMLGRSHGSGAEALQSFSLMSERR